MVTDQTILQVKVALEQVQLAIVDFRVYDAETGETVTTIKPFQHVWIEGYVLRADLTPTFERLKGTMTIVTPTRTYSIDITATILSGSFSVESPTIGSFFDEEGTYVITVEFPTQIIGEVEYLGCENHHLN